jgi:S1-C subfamily serine protease
VEDKDEFADDDEAARSAPPATPGGVGVPASAPWWETPSTGPPGGGGYDSWQPWYAPPPPPARHPRRLWAPAALAAIVAIAIGLGIGYGTGRLGSSPGSVAGVVDPAVVDIDATLAGGTGLEAGTGMLISSNGEVLTNNHVIAGSSSVTIHLADGSVHPARVIGDDPTSDVAVIQIQGVSGLPTVHFADSSQASVGERVYIIGNALGRGGTPKISTGTISALDQTIRAQDPMGATETLEGMIQVDGLIQSGDSGGPLADGNGRIIGIDTAGAGTGSSGQTSSHLGYAIPTNAARPIARNIEAGRAVDGIEIGPGPLIGVEVRDAVGVPTAPVASGAYVAGVEPGTPAAGAGILPGDVVVSLGKHQISSSGDLSDALLADRRGQAVSIGWVDRAGAQHSARITLASGPPA